jgi:phage terminase small subunit
MGRGRAKAKQQKVARELKYSSHYTDLDALQRELGASPSTTTDTVEHADDEDDGADDDQDRWLSAGR